MSHKFLIIFEPFKIIVSKFYFFPWKKKKPIGEVLVLTCGNLADEAEWSLNFTEKEKRKSKIKFLEK